MNDDFEKRLRRVATREIPSAWRTEILTAARARSSRREEAQTPAPASSPGLFAEFIHRLALLTRPQRVAWAGLAAAWVVIVTLNLATRETAKPTSMTGASAPTTPETLQALKQQRLLYAELVGRPEQRPPQRLKTNRPGPRSQRREESATA